MANRAWLRVISNPVDPLDRARAVEYARTAVDANANPHRSGVFFAILGGACYRNGEWRRAAAALEQAERLGELNQFRAAEFLLAMAHWQLGQRDQAREWYERTRRWNDRRQYPDAEARLLQAEALAMILLDPVLPIDPFGP